MEINNIVKEMFNVGIIKKGHFLLTSGYHSKYYINKDAILMYPSLRNKIISKLVEKILPIVLKKKIDIIVSPGNAGISWGSILSFQLGLPFAYTEKVNGEMVLRKNFEKELKNKNVLIVEDIVSTGSSIMKIIKLLKNINANKIYACTIWDRIGNDSIISVFKIKVKSYDPENCCLCKNKIELVDPKSDDVIKVKNFNSNGINIKMDDRDRIFMWDIENFDDIYPIPYKSKIFNGTFKEFKQNNFDNICKNIRLRITRDWETKLDIKVKFHNNQFYFLDNGVKKELKINLKEL